MDPDQVDKIIKFVNILNDRLEEKSQSSTNHAFNLGCSIGIFPGLVAILIVAFISRWNPASILITILLVLLALMIFANLISLQARTRALEKLFQDEVLPEISRTLTEANISRVEFNRIASGALPANATLQKYLSPASEILEN